MADYTDYATAVAAVQSPTTAPADLALICQYQPSLRYYVANHPNVYPELLDWLGAQGDPQVSAVVAARRAAQFAPEAQPTGAPIPASYDQGAQRANPMVLVGIGAALVALVLVFVAFVRPLLGSTGTATPTASSAQVTSQAATLAPTTELTDRYGRDASGQVVASTDLPLTELRIGDCIIEETDPGEVSLIPVVPCSTPHNGEIYATTDAGDFADTDYVRRFCLENFEPYVGRSYIESELYMAWLYPQTTGGNRQAVCVAAQTDAAWTDSIRGSGI